jgi:hypothetical protein
MAEFQATPDDLNELIRSRQRVEARKAAPYPLGAAVVALLLMPLYLPAALVAFGMCVAWSLSTYWSLTSLAASYQWRYAWLQEPIVVEVLEEGLRMSNQRGSSLIRWSGGVVVKALPGCFVLEDEGEDVALVPKRYLSSTELLLLQNRVVA